MAGHTDSTFYVTGGTLRHDAACYVERQADKDVLDGLLKGEFCYVLTSRQMGKSSLMVRTANKLREQGIQVAVLDLTAIGQNLTPEQWYDGLMLRMGRQLRMEDELEDFWEGNRQLGPCQRFFTALREVALAKFPVSSNQSSVISEQSSVKPSGGAAPLNTDNWKLITPRLVIFIDELDVVRSLPFSTDEFFAAIRECYTRRTEDAEFNRLTFCLLGVATPSDLIRDTRLTPFNIGRRIELNDFTPEEAGPLARGLADPTAANAPRSTLPPPPPAAARPRRNEVKAGHAPRLLDRILHWTNGHPYLTQRLCRAVAERNSRGEEAPSEKSEIRNQKSEMSQSLPTLAALRGCRSGSAAPGLIDGLCAELFLSHRAREKDDNLLFVRERILRTEGDLPALLQLYGQVHRGKHAPDDETNPLVASLHLSGIVRSVDGELEARNRIYEQVFDRAWIRASMPDAEVQRQKAAYRRGVFRASAVAAAVVVVMAALALYARKKESIAQQNLYVADMNVVQHAYDDGNLGRARALLEEHAPPLGHKDLRGFEWRYFLNLCRGEQLHTLAGHTNRVEAVAISPDGKILASASSETVNLWNLATRHVIKAVPVKRVVSLSFSPDGQFLALGGPDEVEVWDLTKEKSSSRLQDGGGWFQVAFSPTQNLLAVGRGSNLSGDDGGTVELWNLTTGSKIKLEESGGHAAFSPDGQRLATASWRHRIKIWDAATGRQIGALPDRVDVISLAFSPDGKVLATSTWRGDLRLWDIGRQQLMERLQENAFGIWSLAFSKDDLLAVASRDHSIHIWDTVTRKEVHRFRGHGSDVMAVAFSPDHQLLVSGSQDKTVRLWDPHPKPQLDLLTNVISLPVFSADSKTLAAATPERGLALWDAATRELMVRFEGDLFGLGFLRDGTTFLSISTNQSLRRWNVPTHTLQASIPLPGYEPAQRWPRLSPDGRILAAGLSKSGDKVTLWNTTTGQVMGVLDGHAGSITDLAFSPDSHWLAVSSRGTATKLWNLTTLREKATLRNQNEGAFAVAFSPSGRTLATGGRDDTIRVWDVARGREVFSLTGQKATIRALVFSPDGRTLASAGGDGTIKLLDLATRRELITFRAEPAEVLRFSPDGHTLIGWAAWNDTSLRFWRAPVLAEPQPE